MTVLVLVIQSMSFSFSLNGRLAFNLSANGFSTHRRRDKVERRCNVYIQLIRYCMKYLSSILMGKPDGLHLELGASS